MKALQVDNYIIETPLIDILYHLRDMLNNGKLKDIIDKGDELQVTCPNDEHDGGCEQHPDNHINLKDDGGVPYGVFNCFACGTHGDFVKFVALCMSASYGEAKSWLIKAYGKLSYPKMSLGESIKFYKPIEKKRHLNPAMLDELQTWHPYLAERHLDRQICEKFKVRYDPATQQIVFPIFDEKGNLLMAPRRSVTSKSFMMDKDAEKPLYGLNVIQKNDIKSCLWVEGPIDMLSCWSHGIPAIASLGSPSEGQIQQVNRSCLTEIVLACDNDPAGQAFNDELSKKLSMRILRKPLFWPPGKKDANDLSDDDWDDLIKKYQLKKSVLAKNISYYIVCENTKEKKL